MTEENKYENHKHLLWYSLSEHLAHGMDVSNLAYEIAREMGVSEEDCHELARAGMIHDIGKVTLMGEPELEGNPLVVEEMHYVRLHPHKGYLVALENGYSDTVCESILYHHENYDGSGYPYRLEGRNIPMGARILRVSDVFCALTSDRPYRKAFDEETGVRLMIGEIKNYDMKVFLAFQRVIHRGAHKKVRMPDISLDVRGELKES